MAGTLSLSLTTYVDTSDWAVGKAILQAFLLHDPMWAPEHLTQWSQDAGPFVSVEDVHGVWASPASMRVNGSLSDFKLGLGWHRKSAPRYRADILHHTGKDNRGRPTPGLFFMSANASKADWFGLAGRLVDILRPFHGVLDIKTKDTPRGRASMALNMPAHDYTGVGVQVFLPNDRVSAGHAERIVLAGIEVARHTDFVTLSLMPSVMEAVRNPVQLGLRQEALKIILNDGTHQPPEKPKLPLWWDGR